VRAHCSGGHEGYVGPVNVSVERAVAAIERRGILLVYPLVNRPEPRSLWSELHPRTPMRWAWDSNADTKVWQMWRLREELARSSEVVYAKWFRGRATFFSRPVFRALLGSFAREGELRDGLSRKALLLLELLEDNSPQSTKELRASADLQGKSNEAAYVRALKELWARLLIVGVGEVEDGAFPSLAMSATRLHLELLWPGGKEASTNATVDARALEATLAAAPLFAREVAKTRAGLRASKLEARPDE
jgi:hypothetical protein